MLPVLSETSLASPWVKNEITRAEAEERQRGPVLFPLRIDDAVSDSSEPWVRRLREDRHIGDFRRWKEHDAYQQALARVLRDLRVEAVPD